MAAPGVARGSAVAVGGAPPRARPASARLASERPRAAGQMGRVRTLRSWGRLPPPPPRAVRGECKRQDLWGRNNEVIAWHKSARAVNDPAAGRGGALARLVGRALVDPLPPPARVVWCSAVPCFLRLALGRDINTVPCVGFRPSALWGLRSAHSGFLAAHSGFVAAHSGLLRSRAQWGPLFWSIVTTCCRWARARAGHRCQRAGFSWRGSRSCPVAL